MVGKSDVKNLARRSHLVVKSYKKTKQVRSTVRRQALRASQMRSVLRILAYQDHVLNQQLDTRDFVPLTQAGFVGGPAKKLIAYYLPQYHRIPQNDEWFGPGFTEWNNTSRAVPQFTGHWQPHVPIDVGYYSLETTLPMHRQVELARLYGIHGFCFYYYWFTGGDRLMEKPVLRWLEDKTLDFPFMFFWANEDWTNTWGSPADLNTKTYSAKMRPADVALFVQDILPFVKDDRYITVDGRPHNIIYQAKKDPYLPEFIKKVGALLEAGGVKRPYVSLVFPDDLDPSYDPRNYGADAAVEFGPHLRARPARISTRKTTMKLMNPRARLTEYDMVDFVRKERFLYDLEFPVYKGAMTHFDNTARKIYTGAWIFSTPPEVYGEWLSKLIRHSQTDQIFITAWNEWAEGMHLEPDQKYGYAYLQATKNALEENNTAIKRDDRAADVQESRTQ